MKNKLHISLYIVFLVGIVISAIHPKDYFTWLLEIFPAIIGFVVLIFTYSKFQFTTMTYCFILLHCYILFVGGHYTYAEVPWFNSIKDFFHQDRNNFDKVGHFAQGFVPAMIAREIFIRKHIIPKISWLNVFTVTICMSISMLYAFLGTQGYVWDIQSKPLAVTT